MKILITNDGTSPAEDIGVLLHFPDGFQLFDEESLPQIPAPPAPPDTPKTAHQTMLERMASLVGIGGDSMIRPMLPSVSDFNPPANVSSPTIRRTNSYDVTFPIAKLMHGFREDLHPLYVVFDDFEQASSFHIDYALHAANMPQPATGRLHVVVEKDIRGS